MTQERLNLEIAAMSSVFSPKQFKFYGDYMVFAAQTNSKKVYTIKVFYGSNFPNERPRVYITNPKVLLMRNGQPMPELSRSMHTLNKSTDGYLQVCHYGAIDWHPGVSLYQVIVKVRVWLEMYEAHLKTGHPLAVEVKIQLLFS